jgi:hypothetical protein
MEGFFKFSIQFFIEIFIFISNEFWKNASNPPPHKYAGKFYVKNDFTA